MDDNVILSFFSLINSFTLYAAGPGTISFTDMRPVSTVASDTVTLARGPSSAATKTSSEMLKCENICQQALNKTRSEHAQTKGGC